MPLMMWLAVAVWTIVILLPLWPQIKREWCEGRRCRVWVYECGACRGSGLAWDDDEFECEVCCGTGVVKNNRSPEFVELLCLYVTKEGE